MPPSQMSTVTAQECTILSVQVTALPYPIPALQSTSVTLTTCTVARETFIQHIVYIDDNIPTIMQVRRCFEN